MSWRRERDAGLGTGGSTVPSFSSIRGTRPARRGIGEGINDFLGHSATRKWFESRKAQGDVPPSSAIRHISCPLPVWPKTAGLDGIQYPVHLLLRSKDYAYEEASGTSQSTRRLDNALVGAVGFNPTTKVWNIETHESSIKVAAVYAFHFCMFPVYHLACIRDPTLLSYRCPTVTLWTFSKTSLE